MLNHFHNDTPPSPLDHLSAPTVRLQHLAIRVSDLKEASRFFMRTLHLGILRQHQNMLIMGIINEAGMKEQVVALQRKPEGEQGSTIAHLGFAVESAMDMANLQERLTVLGIAFTESRMGSAIYFDGPDGILCEVCVPELISRIL